ncbi:geraniol dehydrogenase [Nocardioides sp. Root190]|uniref:NAD(P)-dependent alcohol dehydrogenase n=1 Tax=Nocardioides sp. Root190 TaxID=1736488 RepID=UPI0006FB32AB|nr:NAD(P)-dependent alcohol dehydrogenase [Nocardioides sp. Root190]KRB76107.1 geraniol dehydrogenase [Nocardioides sp. Root190]
MQIKAAVVNEVGGDFTIEDIEIGDPQSGEVLVDIAAVGLCHTDLAAQHGHLPFPMPGVVGHEGAGTVRAIGEGVTKVAVGDKVALTFNSCGECASCKKAEPGYCVSFMALNFGGVRPDGTSGLSKDGVQLGANFFGQSSFATAAIANQRNVVKLADDADLVLAGPLGCGIQTGAGAVMNTFDAQAGEALLVMGGGSVGLSGALAAVARNVGTIIVVEPVAARRELALELGATHAIDPAAGPVSEQVRAIIPAGVDYVLDTTANAAVLGEAFASLGYRGTVGLIGVPADPEAVMAVPMIPAQVLGAKVIGIVEGDSNPDEFIPELVALHAAGKFPYDRLISTRPFSELNEAIAAQARGEAIKIVLTHG